VVLKYEIWIYKTICFCNVWSLKSESEVYINLDNKYKSKKLKKISYYNLFHLLNILRKLIKVDLMGPKKNSTIQTFLRVSSPKTFASILSFLLHPSPPSPISRSTSFSLERIPNRFLDQRRNDLSDDVIEVISDARASLIVLDRFQF